MHRDNLNLVFEKYIEQFAALNDTSSPNARDEGYKWDAVTCFREHWDINADDFATMFKASMKETGGLIDGASVQPINGILQLACKGGEADIIRQCLADLFVEDGGDLHARQNRIDAFIAKINERVDIYYSGSWKFQQTYSSVIGYLNLWRPEENYFYKSTEANSWANWIEYGDDFGSGSTFSLPKYYRMCDELRENVRQNPEIMALNEQRVQGRAVGYDDQQHILVYDIIYCALTVPLYDDARMFKGSIKGRIERAQLHQQIDECNDHIAEYEAQINALQSQLVELPDITGAEVTSERFGVGTVTSCTNGTMVVEYVDVGQKKHSYPLVFATGQLTCGGEYGDIFTANNRLNSEIKAIQEQLNKERIRLSLLQK